MIPESLVFVLALLSAVASLAYAVIAEDMPRANFHLLWAVVLLVVVQGPA